MPINRDDIIMKILQQNNKLIDMLINDKKNADDINDKKNADDINDKYDSDEYDTDDDEYATNRDYMCKKFLISIIDTDGILLGGVRYNWKKYKGENTIRVDYKVLYNEYIEYCKKYNYKNHIYDLFIEVLTYDKQTGIEDIFDRKVHKNRLTINKTIVLEYIKQ